MKFPWQRNKKKSKLEFKTVHFAFPAVVLTLLFAGLASVITEDASFIRIKTTVSTINKDQDFFVDVSVNAHVPVNAVDIALSYPENKIKVIGVDTGTSVITLWTETPHAENGHISLRGGTYRKGFVGEHTIARLHLKAIEAGDAKILLTNSALIAGDGKGTTVPASQNASSNETQISILDAKDGVARGRATITVITDTDGDGDVDVADITAFMTAWFTQSTIFDFNADGVMNFRDFSILLSDSFFK